MKNLKLILMLILIISLSASAVVSKDVFVFCNAVRAGPTIEAKRMISFDNQKKGSVKPIHWPIRQK